MHFLTSSWRLSLLLAASFLFSRTTTTTAASSSSAEAAAAAVAATENDHNGQDDDDPIPASTRAHWMSQAKAFLHSANGGSPCPYAAFGAAIVNHSSSITSIGGIGGIGSGGGRRVGELVCLGVNTVRKDGNPILHGEIAAINNCTEILTSPTGRYKFTGVQALDALRGLSLYTTAEACPMCAAAITHGQMAEYIFATSSPDLEKMGWPQNGIRSLEVLQKAPPRSNVGPVDVDVKGHDGGGLVNPTDRTRIVQGVLREETDELFGWQFRDDGACPSGCVRDAGGDAGGGCVPAGQEGEHDEL